MNVRTRRVSIAVTSTGVAAGLVIGGVVSSSDAAAPPTKTVKIISMFAGYSPSKLTVKKGTKVTWKNLDTTSNHTVTSNPQFKSPAKFGSPALGTGRTFSYTFTKTGVYHYYCTIHRGMTGIVTVTN
jgi:plastocyanin